MLNKSHSIYAILSLSAASLSFYKLGYLANSLSSESFGMYSLIILSYVYIVYIGSMGGNEYMLKTGAVIDSSNKELLFVTRNNALIYGIFGIAVISLIVIVFVNYFLEIHYEKISYTIVALALVTYPYNVFESYFRSQLKIIVSSAMLFAKSFFVLIGMYFLLEKYGLFGAIISEIASLLIIITFFLLKDCNSFLQTRLERPKDALFRIFFNGFSVCMSNMFRNIALASDRYAVAIIFGLHYFGVYSFVMIVYQGAILFSSIITNVIGPRLIKYHDERKSNKDLAFILAKLLILSFAFSLISFPAYMYFTPVIILNYFEQYNNSEVHLALNLVYWSSFASFCVFLLDWFFVCISKERVLSFLSIFSLALTFVSFVFFKYFDFDFIFFVVFFLLSKLIVLFIMIHMTYSLREAG